MKNNNVVLLISSNSSGRGGGERYLVFMAIGLIALNYEVHVLLSTEDYMNGWEVELNEVGAIVHRRRLRGLIHRPLRFLQSISDRSQHKSISDICRQISPSAILVNQQYDEDGLDYLMGALGSNICPVAGIIHMPMTADKNARPLGKLRGLVLRNWYKKYAHKLLFSSKGSEREFQSYYHLDFDTVVIPSGVPLNKELINPEKAVERLDDPWINAAYAAPGKRLPFIGVVCQFVPQKNLNLLVDAWIASSGNGTETRLLLIGDGPERRNLESRLQHVDQSMWHITGWGDKYADYMALLDLFIMPSSFESLPLALIEVVGMGIESIISDFNGACELAEQAKWVHIFKSTNPEELGNLITQRVQVVCNQVGASSVERERFVEYFSPRRMANDFLTSLGVQ